MSGGLRVSVALVLVGCIVQILSQPPNWGPGGAGPWGPGDGRSPPPRPTDKYGSTLPPPSHPPRPTDKNGSTLPWPSYPPRPTDKYGSTLPPPSHPPRPTDKNGSTLPPPTGADGRPLNPHPGHGFPHKSTTAAAAGKKSAAIAAAGKKAAVVAGKKGSTKARHTGSHTGTRRHHRG